MAFLASDSLTHCSPQDLNYVTLAWDDASLKVVYVSVDIALDSLASVHCIWILGPLCTGNIFSGTPPHLTSLSEPHGQPRPQKLRLRTRRTAFPLKVIVRDVLICVRYF